MAEAEETEIQVLAEAKKAESIHSAQVAHEANENAREAQMEAVFDRAFKKAFTLDDGVTRRFVDVSRANLICQTIVGIETRLQNIEGNITWGVRIVIGAVIVAVLTLIFK